MIKEVKQYFINLYIESRISNDNSEQTLSEQLFDSKIWRKEQINNVKEDSLKESKKKDKNINNSNNTCRNNNNNNLSPGTNIPKKLPFSLQTKAYGFMNKKINMNPGVNNNNIINNIYNNKQFMMNHNLSKYTSKKNNENLSLLDKIKDKVNIELKTNSKKKKEGKTKIENSKEILENKIEENKEVNKDGVDKNEDETKEEDNNNDEEDDILSEEEDEMEEGGPNIINSINIHSNFIKKHYYSGSGFSMNSNNSNSNNSSIIQKCVTEPDEYSFYPQSYLNAPLSGRSNYSGNNNPQMSQMRFLPGGGIENNCNRLYGLNGQNNAFKCQIKNSFLSTNTNTNSHNQSGYKVDTSISNESGQSPQYMGKYQKLQYNNSMTNIAKNNPILYPFPSSITPIDVRPIYTSNFNSNENLFKLKQPFSVNQKTFTNNFNYSKKEKQIIKLEDVALGKETRTTVMIRNIPIKYNDEILEKELEQFEGKYDCLYMPFDYENGGNKGYAFLNLTSPYHVLLFFEIFNNKCWRFFDSRKICELNYANFQGIEEIKKHAKNYKGCKKPNFYINTKGDNINSKIEIPYKYLNLVLKENPKMKYSINKQKTLFTVESFN